MATPYTDVYEFFLSKISDYAFLKFTDEELVEEFFIYLRTAISNFEVSKVDLSERDDVLREFANDLTDKEKDILASLMVVAYLKPRVVTSENYKLAMSDSDYRIYSQANHIKEVMNLYKEVRKEVEKLMTRYTYKNIDWDKLK